MSDNPRRELLSSARDAESLAKTLPCRLGRYIVVAVLMKRHSQDEVYTKLSDFFNTFSEMRNHINSTFSKRYSNWEVNPDSKSKWNSKCVYYGEIDTLQKELKFHYESNDSDLCQIIPDLYKATNYIVSLLEFSYLDAFKPSRSIFYRFLEELRRMLFSIDPADDN